MVVYVVVTSFLRNVAFLIYALFGEISILEIPVVGNFSLFAGLAARDINYTVQPSPITPGSLLCTRTNLAPGPRHR